MKMLNAQHLQKEALAAGVELPKFARDPDRWQGYLKFLGRQLPWQDTWGHACEEFQASGFHKEMQLRKYLFGDLWYKAFLLAIAAGSRRGWRVAETTAPDAIYAIDVKFERALGRIRAGEDFDVLLQGGRNILGKAHVEAASYVSGDELGPLLELLSVAVDEGGPCVAAECGPR